MNIYLRWDEVHELLRYDEPSIEDLVGFWARYVSGAVMPTPEAILVVYEKLHSGLFEVVDYPSIWNGACQRTMVLVSCEREHNSE